MIDKDIQQGLENDLDEVRKMISNYTFYASCENIRRMANSARPIKDIYKSKEDRQNGPTST